jgi:hypothetical protein
MNVARTRLLLKLTTALGAAGAAVVWAVAALPMDVSAPAGQIAQTPVAPSVSKIALPPLEEFEPAWRSPLRRPLTDPPPLVAAAPAPARPPNLMVRLVGTIVDGQRPRGVFLVGLASIEVKGVGEKAGGAEILRIGENDAALSFAGETFVLKREKHPFDPNGGSSEPAAAQSDGGTSAGQ